MRKIALYALVAWTLASASCGALDPAELEAFENASILIGRTLADDIQERFREYEGTDDERKRATLRNGLAGRVMFVVDYNYQQYIDGFSARRQGTKIVLDTASIASAGAATVTTPMHVARLLAAISTMLQAVNGATEEHVFLGMATTAFVSQTQKDRAEIRTRIIQGLVLPTERYTIYACLSDLSLYAEAGNINTAAAKLEESNAAATKAAREAANQLQEKQVAQVMRLRDADIQTAANKAKEAELALKRMELQLQGAAKTLWDFLKRE
jgi:hypothetical protein